MKKRRIVIASVLKPVDDPRMFEKMAMTLGDSGAYEVFIIGYPSKQVISHPIIQFIPLSPFSRISVNRLLIALKIQRIILQLKPDILVVNTHELLIVAFLNRIYYGRKVIYDIRENYFRNILYSEAFPLLFRPFLAGWVRLKEIITSPVINRFILAESGYKKEMRFFAKRYIIIENKVKMPLDFRRVPRSGRTRLLFSGTLAESTGLFKAIDLARKLHEVDPAVQLTIIGYAAKPDVLARIHGQLATGNFMQLIGGDQLVPHNEIMSAISESDFGIIAYPPSPHTENSIPTKLYEYLACQLPILLQPHPVWEQLCAPYSACIPVDFGNIDAKSLFLQMQSEFYKQKPAGVTWESEAPKLIQVLSSI